MLYDKLNLWICKEFKEEPILSGKPAKSGNTHKQKIKQNKGEPTMLKKHLKTAIALALIFVMVFALTAPALAEENSDLAAAEEAVREAEENYNIAAERYDNLYKNRGQVTIPTSELRKLETRIKGLEEEARSQGNPSDILGEIQNLRDYINNYGKKAQEKLNAAREEMYWCELQLDIAKNNLEKLQQALIIPQTGDSGAVYLAAGVMLILAGAGLAVSRKRS
jgi:LPXTG-motif cell wall-anchored protein